MATKKELQEQIEQLRQELRSMDEIRRSVLGRNLIHYRKLHGMTQEDLANRLDCQRPTIANIERGVNSTKLDTLMRICEIFSVTPNDLLLQRSGVKSAQAAK